MSRLEPCFENDDPNDSGLDSTGRLQAFSHAVCGNRPYCWISKYILGTTIVLCVQLLLAAGAVAQSPRVDTDLLIVGGTESGCAAAIQAARMGVKSITIVNDIDWLGGQFSAEALVAIDENRGPAGYDHTVPFPRAGLFREVIDRIEAINLQKYGVARPGNTRVITTCRPADAERVFREMLQPYIDSGQVRIISNHYPVEALVAGDTLTGMRFRSSADDASDLTVSAALTIDASDWGDAIKLAGADYEFGPDLKATYGEPLAPDSRDEYPLTDMNPITYCMVIVESDRYAPIPEPLGYDVRNYDGHPYPKDPLWLYASRRLVDHYGFPDIQHPDVLLLCFPTFDYPLDVLPKTVADALEAMQPGASRLNIVQMTRQQRQLVFEDAKQHSLGFLYYLQTVVHDEMPDKTHSFRRFKLSDEFGTPDKMPPKPYVRESLRLKAAYMMRQQDTTGFGGQARNYASAMYDDGIACWQFEYDFHPTKREFLDEHLGSAGPWQGGFRRNRTWGPPYSGKSLFPLRSLVPEKVDGLLGAQKNLGYSSIVSSALRLHDQSIAVGQAAGAVAAVAIQTQTLSRELPYRRELLSRIREGLCSRLDGGQPHTLWPFADLEPDHAAFEPANLLAIRGGLPLRGIDVRFEADQPASAAWRAAVVEKSLSTKLSVQPPTPPEGEMTRGEFVRRWWARIKELPDKPWERITADDSDGDGLADVEDPLLFSPGASSWGNYAPPPDEDGHPNDDLPVGEDPKLFNFTGVGSPIVEGFTNDNGLPFSKQHGFGWSRDIRPNNRRRGQIEGDWRDTFLFTRSHDVWSCAVPNGRNAVTVCVGDSGHEQAGQNVSVEGQAMLRAIDTAAGQFAEKTIEVEVTDERLDVEIGLAGSTTNTCLNWLRYVRLKTLSR